MAQLSSCMCEKGAGAPGDQAVGSGFFPCDMTLQQPDPTIWQVLTLKLVTVQLRKALILVIRSLGNRAAGMAAFKASSGNAASSLATPGVKRCRQFSAQRPPANILICHMTQRSTKRSWSMAAAWCLVRVCRGRLVGAAAVVAGVGGGAAAVNGQSISNWARLVCCTVLNRYVGGCKWFHTFFIGNARLGGSRSMCINAIGCWAVIGTPVGTEVRIYFQEAPNSVSIQLSTSPTWVPKWPT